MGRRIDSIKSGFRAYAESFSRSVPIGDPNSSPNIDKDFWKSFGRGFGGGTMTRAGTTMGPIQSLRVAANLACIGLNARVMAAIPCNLRRYRNPKTHTGGSDIVHQNPFNQALSMKANRNTTAFQWQLSSIFNRMTYGTSYSIRDVNTIGQTTDLWQCLSANVEAITLDNLGQLSEWDDIARVGDIAYRITKTWPTPSIEIWPASRVLPIPGMVSLNGVSGIPPSDLLSVRLSTAKALGLWEADYFGKGYSAAYIGTVQDTIGKTARKALVDGTAEEFAGFNANHKIMLGPEGVDLKLAEHRLDHAMLDQRERAAVEDICGFHGISPVLIGRVWGATFNNSWEYFNQFLKTAIYPAAKNDTLAFDCWCLNDAQRRAGFFAAYDVSQLLKMDPEAWAKMTQVKFLAGAISQDEIREEDGKNPWPDGIGENPMVQMQMEFLKEKLKNGTPGKTTIVTATGEENE